MDEAVDLKMRIDGNDFRDRRIALMLNRDELAEEIGVSEETVKSWELARRPIPRYALRSLCRLEAQKRKGRVSRSPQSPSHLPST